MKGLQSLVIFLTMLLLPTYSYAKDYSDYVEECEPIREEIQSILEYTGVSKDYFFLLVAESHCQNKTSKAGARGMWQMMPATAKKYGCNNPEDLICLTHAAAKYLQHLEMKCGHDNVIFCWHDGGSNFLKKEKIPTSGARGLNWQFRHLTKSFYSSQWAGKSEDEEG